MKANFRQIILSTVFLPLYVGEILTFCRIRKTGNLKRQVLQKTSHTHSLTHRQREATRWPEIVQSVQCGNSVVLPHRSVTFMQLKVAILVGCDIVQFVSSVIVLQQCCDGSVLLESNRLVHSVVRW